jgi:cyclohexyl-isocyanide hydratase
VTNEESGRPVVAMVVYPGMTMLDLIGPHETLHHRCDVHLVGADTAEFISESGVPLRATVSFDQAPPDVDVLFVPGGIGTAGAMRNARLLGFLADRGARARYVTSVCTGSLILGAAGLLRGYKASSHWATRHLLGLCGAVPTQARVVLDRNRITGGGVTAGIDFGLTLLAELFGEQAARLTQLTLEYDPDPPFASGSPVTAAPEDVAAVRGFAEPINRDVEDTFAALAASSAVN